MSSAVDLDKNKQQKEKRTLEGDAHVQHRAEWEQEGDRLGTSSRLAARAHFAHALTEQQSLLRQVP